MTSPADRGRALEMHLAGAPAEAIASAAGFASAEDALAAVWEQLGARGPATEVDAAVSELARMDALLVGLWPRARRGDLDAIDMVLKISDRRLRLVAVAGQGDARQVGEEATPLDELRRRRAARGPGAQRSRRAEVAQ